jgi:hypothetical protein
MGTCHDAVKHAQTKKSANAIPFSIEDTTVSLINSFAKALAVDQSRAFWFEYK